MTNINIQFVRWSNELCFYFWRDKQWRMRLSLILIDQCRSHVWFSHSSFQGQLFVPILMVLQPNLSALSSVLGSKCLKLFAWQHVCKDFDRWKDNIFYGKKKLLLKAPRINLCAVREKSYQFQLKVCSTNSICHGLHGCKIRTSVNSRQTEDPL